MVTLDELDASRTAHEREIKTERRAKEKLSEKLDRYLDEVKRAEGERDEMREVVSILVEKGAWLVMHRAVFVNAAGIALPFQLCPSFPVRDEQEHASGLHIADICKWVER